MPDTVPVEHSFTEDSRAGGTIPFPGTGLNVPDSMIPRAAVRDDAPGTLLPSAAWPSSHPGEDGHALDAAGSTPEPASVPPAAQQSWTVELPAGLELLSLNHREHHMVEHRKFQTLKTAAWAMLRNAKVPQLERVTVSAVYFPPDARRRDPDNLIVKPFLDAMVAAGILVDDNKRHVAWAHFEISEKVKRPSRVRLIITEMPPLPSGEAG